MKFMYYRLRHFLFQIISQDLRLEVIRKGCRTTKRIIFCSITSKQQPSNLCDFRPAMCDLILSLPTVLSCVILSAWLHVPNLAKLDSTYCHRKKREQLQVLYEQPELICSLKRCPMRHIIWLLKRRIRLRRFYVWDGLPIELSRPYLKEFGRLIQSLNIASVASMELVEALTQHAPNVVSVDIIRIDVAILECLHFFQRIEQLKMRVAGSKHSKALPTNLLQLPNLRKLTIKWQNVANKDIIAFVARCPYLTHLSLYNFTFFAPCAALIQMISAVTYLIALDVSELNVDDAALTVIAENCLSIVHLDVSDCDKITDAGIYRVATTLKLKSIALPCDYKVTDMSLEYLSYCAGTLKILHIAQRVGYSDPTMPKITRCAIDGLLSKTVNCVCTWTTYIYNPVRDWCVCTQSTHILIYTKLTDPMLLDIAKFCKHLIYLEIDVDRDTDATMTSQGMCAMITSCPMLQFIYIGGMISKTRYADVMSEYAKLFTCTEVSAYDVMEMV